MFKDAPRPLLAMLAFYFLLEVAAALLTGELYQLARTVVVAIAAWRTLQGSRPASFFLGGLFTLGALLSVKNVVSLVSISGPAAVFEGIFAMFLASIAAYVFLSPGMRAIYSRADQSRWQPR